MIMAWLFRRAGFFMNTALVCLLMLFTAPAHAYFSLDLSGNMSDSYVDLEEHVDTTATASAMMGLGDYFIISVGYQREVENKSGFRKAQTGDNNVMYYKFTDDSEQNTVFSDLTVILSNGMFSPFIFGGIARKDFYTKISYPGTVYKSHIPMPLTNRYGFGFSLMLSREFRLKVTQTFSPGLKTELDDRQAEVQRKFVSTTTEIGISIRFN